jgi:NADPH:quinone reductase-like Zn-dependent oxidoreductase
MPEVPKRMRAAFVTELGPAELIRVGELPVPGLGPTDVLVVGRDLVGTVAAAGAGAAGFAPRERVWCNSLGHGGRQGSFAEYAVVPAERLYRAPAAVDPVTTVAVLHPGATAYLAVFRHGGLRPGETVYVGGAAGNVGTAVTSLPRTGGARVLAGARSDDARWCRSAGAAEVVDYRHPDLPERLRALAPTGIDLYIDTSGHLDLPAVVDLLADRGRIVLLAGGGQRLTLPVGPLYTHDRRILGFVISRAGVEELAEAAAVLNGHLAAGVLPVRVRDTWPLDRPPRPPGGRARRARPNRPACRPHPRLNGCGARGAAAQLRHRRNASVLSGTFAGSGGVVAGPQRWQVARLGDGAVVAVEHPGRSFLPAQRPGDGQAASHELVEGHPDRLPVAAQHRGRERRVGEQRQHRRCGGVDPEGVGELDGQRALLGEGGDGLLAAHGGAGQDARDRGAAQAGEQPMGFALPSGRQGPVAVGAGPLVLVAGVSVADKVGHGSSQRAGRGPNLRRGPPSDPATSRTVAERTGSGKPTTDPCQGDPMLAGARRPGR